MPLGLDNENIPSPAYCDWVGVSMHVTQTGPVRASLGLLLELMGN